MSQIAIVSEKIGGAIGGAESILFGAHELYPQAPIYCTAIDWSIVPAKYRHADYRTTFIDKLPLKEKLYKLYFPISFLAHELLDLQAYDVIFSSHYSVAKSIIPRPDAVHVCYCHSPARYIWDMFWTYTQLKGFGKLLNGVIGAKAQYLRMLDYTSAARVDHFLANSSYTAKRIEKFYGRRAEVLFPPVRTNKFLHQAYEDFYLMAGRLVGYKGFELAVDAFNESGKRLIIIGDGPLLEKLRAKAKPNVTLLGWVEYDVLVHHMNTCRAFLFPGKEDFGIVMAEAQAAGKPVIGFKAGGALDIVKDGQTGVLFPELTTASLNQAILQAEQMSWDPHQISLHGKMFDESHFKARLHYILENAPQFARTGLS